MAVFCLSFYWKLGYNPSLFDILDDLLGFQVQKLKSKIIKIFD